MWWRWKGTCVSVISALCIITTFPVSASRLSLSFSHTGLYIHTRTHARTHIHVTPRRTAPPRSISRHGLGFLPILLSQHPPVLLAPRRLSRDASRDFSPPCPRLVAQYWLLIDVALPRPTVQGDPPPQDNTVDPDSHSARRWLPEISIWCDLRAHSPQPPATYIY